MTIENLDWRSRLKARAKQNKIKSIVDSRLAGMPLLDITRSFDISIRTLKKILSENLKGKKRQAVNRLIKKEREARTIDSRNKWNEIKKARDSSIKSERLSGCTVSDIAAAHDISESSVKKILHRLDIKTGQPARTPLQLRKNLERDMEIFKQYMQGRRAPDLAHDFFLDRCHVLKIVRELIALGVKP